MRVIFLSAVGLAAFVVLALAVNARLLAGVDLRATLAMQPLVRPLLSDLAIAAAFLLSAELCALYGVIFAAILWHKGAGLRSVLPLAFVVPIAVETVLKHLVHQPLVPLAYYHDVPLPLLDVPTPSSFPSGHVLRAAWFAVFLAVLFRPGSAWLRWAGRALCLAVVVFVALTRVYLGVHWLSDVVGGALLGAALAWPAAALLRIPRGIPRGFPDPCHRRIMVEKSG